MYDNPSSNETVRCSFCGKTQEEVKKIVAGPGVYICNECIDLCKEIIDELPTLLDKLGVDHINELYGRTHEVTK